MEYQRRRVLQRGLALAATPLATRVATAVPTGHGETMPGSNVPTPAPAVIAPAAASPPLASAQHAQPFDYAWLKGAARALAASPWRAPPTDLPPSLATLDYDGFQSIRFRPPHSLWAATPSLFQVRFFHLGYRYTESVRMHEVVDGVAHTIGYDPAMFDLSHAGVDPADLSPDLGFAGFRVHFHTNWDADIAAFLGASYFRAVGVERQYGLSARGLAVDTGSEGGEEFPRFTAFWFERPADGAGAMTLYALLDSPSICGAYRFGLEPGASTLMDIDAALYPRKAIERLGIAPLTSMYLTGENDRRMGDDWRPEVHDSDGLSMHNGAGEWIWRPLVNPPDVRLNSFVDHTPRGFGLLQRDRIFDHYQDDSVYYDRRPSAWVEPKDSAGGFGRGAVQLLEFAAGDETVDNVVTWWNPSTAPTPGREMLYGYRLYWGARAPSRTALARVIATRTGIGGVVGQRRAYFSWRFAVDFTGGELGAVPDAALVEPVITVSRGKVEITSARPQRAISGYRAMFDLRPADDDVEPVDLRLFLRLDGAALTETWLYQWSPPPLEERRRLLAL